MSLPYLSALAARNEVGKKGREERKEKGKGEKLQTCIHILAGHKDKRNGVSADPLFGRKRKKKNKKDTGICCAIGTGAVSCHPRKGSLPSPQLSEDREGKKGGKNGGKKESTSCLDSMSAINVSKSLAPWEDEERGEKGKKNMLVQII